MPKIKVTVGKGVGPLNPDDSTNGENIHGLKFSCTYIGDNGKAVTPFPQNVTITVIDSQKASHGPWPINPAIDPLIGFGTSSAPDNNTFQDGERVSYQFNPNNITTDPTSDFILP